MSNLKFYCGVYYGTVVTEDGHNFKQTYGYTFKRKNTVWYALLLYMLLKHGCTKKECLEYVNRLHSGNLLTSNHDLITALHNCGIIYSVRLGKTNLWYADKVKAVELINNAK